MGDLWIPGVPIDVGVWHGEHVCRPEVTCHRTYGAWGGDYSTIKYNGLAHLLIGKDEGQWVQFAPANIVQWHDAVNVGYGIEVTGINEDDMTDWQVRCLAYCMPQLENMIGVPRVYSDGSDGWVDVNYWNGWHSHNMIIPSGGGSQHTNLWKRSDWDRIIQLVEGTGAKPPKPKETKHMIYHVVANHDPDANTPTGEWVEFFDTGSVNISAGDAFIKALGGIPWWDNMTIFHVLAENKRRAQARQTAKYWDEFVASHPAA